MTSSTNILSIRDVEKFIIENRNSGKKCILNCGKSLFLTLQPSGTCTFTFRQKVKGKDLSIKLGHFPNISLDEAREAVKREETKIKAQKELLTESLAPTFGNYSQEWLSFFNVKDNGDGFHKNNKRFYSIRASLKVISGLDKYPIDKITPLLVDKILSVSDKTQGAKYTAIRILNQCLNSAVVDGLITSNPCINMLNASGLISRKYKKPKVVGYAWVPAEQLKEKYFDKLSSQPMISRVFYVLQVMTCLRDGSLSELEWSWIDFEKKVISIPAVHMKMSRDFTVPLTKFMEAILLKWKKQCEYDNKDSIYVFYSRSSVNKSIRLISLQEPVTSCTNREVTMHGMRKSARTWMASIGVPESIAEYVLSHVPKNKIVNIYNKHDYLRERMPVMRLWNYYIYTQLSKEYTVLFGQLPQDYLDKCKHDLELQMSRVEMFNGFEDE